MAARGQIVRCAWVGSDPLMTAYHDNEWGVPLHDDRRLFEFLVLDAFQAGFRLMRDTGEGLALVASGFATAFVLWKIAGQEVESQ